MILKWHPHPKDNAVEATGENGVYYKIIRTSNKFWLSRGDIDPVGRKGNKAALQRLAQLLENERCGAVGCI